MIKISNQETRKERKTKRRDFKVRPTSVIRKTNIFSPDHWYLLPDQELETPDHFLICFLTIIFVRIERKSFLKFLRINDFCCWGLLLAGKGIYPVPPVPAVPHSEKRSFFDDKQTIFQRIGGTKYTLRFRKAYWPVADVSALKSYLVRKPNQHSEFGSSPQSAPWLLGRMA